MPARPGQVFAITLSQDQPKNLAEQPYQKRLRHIRIHEGKKILNSMLLLRKYIYAAELDTSTVMERDDRRVQGGEHMG